MREADRLSEPELRDFIPLLIDTVADVLGGIGHSEAAARDAGHQRPAKEHAEHRLMQGYSTLAALRELSHFRAAILELCAKRDVVLGGDVAVMMHSHLDEVMVTAANHLEHRRRAEVEEQRNAVESEAKALERAVRLRDEVMAIVAHDLRNPLNAIAMHANLLVRDKIAPEAAGAAGALIQRNVRRTMRLIDDLLLLAKLESGHLVIEPHRMNARDLARDAVEPVRLVVDQKGVRLEHPSDGEPVMVSCDRDRILQVVANLLDNAIKLTPEGGLVGLSVTRTSDECIFSVYDTGAGMSDDVKAHVFDRFWQAPNQTRQGTGLGLAIARGIVIAHGGRIWVESEPGTGSTFSFALPLQVSGAPPPNAFVGDENER